MNGTALAMEQSPPDLVVQSSLLGTLSVPHGQSYVMKDGLLGFPNAKDFALVPTERPGMLWLQSVDFEALTFLLVDPFQYLDGYSLELGAKELGGLESEDPSKVLILCILTLPRSEDDQPTVNLQGPLAFDLEKREARQIILQDSPYGTRHALDLGAVKES